MQKPFFRKLPFNFKHKHSPSSSPSPNPVKIRNRVLIITVCAVLITAILGSVCFFSGIGKPERVVPAGKCSSYAHRTSSETRSHAPSAASFAAKPSQSAAKAVCKPKKVIYLTFDDGPSTLTVPLLNVLDKYHVKATFFVVGINDKNEASDLKEIVRRGHAIGVHSYTHNYRQIYASPEAFFSDFDEMHSLIKNATGIDTKIYRFPGGSVNAYNKKTRKAIIQNLKQRGYVFFDWNAGGGDAVVHPQAAKILSEALTTTHMHDNSVVLFHNSSVKSVTLSIIPQFISTLQKEGYTFAVLNPSVDNHPFIFYHDA
mgnify:CR=1 FL=1